MAGFFRKVAGAFVELPEAPRTPPPDEALSEDVSELLADLAPDGAPLREADALGMSADAVFAEAGIVEGPNSTRRLLKMLAGLAMFPPDQQLAMVRALDAADESWTEPGVLADARQRQQALRLHEDRVEREHAQRAASLAERGRADQARGDSAIADIDAQIAGLQRLRQEALSETAQVMAALDTERRELDRALADARKSNAELAVQLSQLITFFAGSRSVGGNGGT